MVKVTKQKMWKCVAIDGENKSEVFQIEEREDVDNFRKMDCIDMTELFVDRKRNGKLKRN